MQSIRPMQRKLEAKASTRPLEKNQSILLRKTGKKKKSVPEASNENKCQMWLS